MQVNETPEDRLFRLQRLFDSAIFEDQDRALLEYSDFFNEVESELHVSKGLFVCLYCVLT